MAESEKSGIEIRGGKADIFQLSFFYRTKSSVYTNFFKKKFFFVGSYRVPETLSDEILIKMSAVKQQDFPIANLETLTEYDAFLFGVPTRFGNMPAQIKVRCFSSYAFIHASFCVNHRHSGMLQAVFGRMALLMVNMLAYLYLLRVPVEVKKIPS